MNKDLARLLDDLVNRMDEFVKTSKGNHCLTKEPEWTRLECLEQHFGRYDDRSLKAILALLEAPPAEMYDRLNDYHYIAPKL